MVVVLVYRNRGTTENEVSEPAQKKKRRREHKHETALI